MRVILPDGDEAASFVASTPPARVVSGWFWGGLAAAASVMLAVWASQSPRTPAQVSAAVPRTEESDASFETASAVFQALSPLPTLAQAQAMPVGNTRRIDTGIDGAMLVPGRWQYSTPVTDTRGAPATTQTITLDRTSLQQRSVWRLVTTTDYGRGVAVDTTILESRDLRPVERRWHVQQWSIRQEYGREQPNEIFTVANRVTMDSTVVARSDTMRLAINPTGLLLETNAQLILLFKLVRLDRNWQITYGRAGGRSSASNHVAAQSRTLRVDGDELIRTARGDLPVWRVLDDGAPGQIWYVSKATREVVRVADRGPRSTSHRLDLQ